MNWRQCFCNGYNFTGLWVWRHKAPELSYTSFIFTSRGSTIPQAPVINLMKFLDYWYLHLTASHYATQENFIPTATQVFVISLQYFTRFRLYRERSQGPLRGLSMRLLFIQLGSFSETQEDAMWTYSLVAFSSIKRTMKSENVFFLKSFIYWVITLCSPLKIIVTFRGNMSLPSSGWRNKQRN
jgi:hypothetical protein